MKKLVIIVDMQYDFMDFEDSKLPIPDSKQIIQPMNDYLKTLTTENTAAVLVTQDWHTAEHVEYMPDGNPFPSHCVMDTKGAEVVFDKYCLNSSIPTYNLKKNVFDMWEEDGLTVTTDSMSGDRNDWFAFHKNSGVTEVEVVGVAADVCVLQAILGCLKMGFNVTVRRNLTKGIFKDIDQVAEDENLTVTLV